MTPEGAQRLLAPNYAGSSRAEAVKRGKTLCKAPEVDLAALKKLAVQLQQARGGAAGGQRDAAVLRSHVEQLLKQLQNVAQNAEKQKRRDSMMKGLFAKRRGSDVTPASFSVAGLHFETADASLNDLVFASYEEFQQFIMEATIEKTERAQEAPPAAPGPQAQMTADVTWVVMSYEVAGKLRLFAEKLVLRADSFRPVANQLARRGGVT